MHYKCSLKNKEGLTVVSHAKGWYFEGVPSLSPL